MYGWQVKSFRTYENMQKFIDKIKNNYQYREIFINNGYCIEYRKLIKIY